MTAKMQKKSVVKKNFSSITMSINNAEFHAEGDAAEVSAKFKKWLDETLAPIGRTMETIKREAQK